MNWRPSADWETLELRARLLAAVRGFFADRGLVEVQTPALVPHAVTDPHLANVEARLAVRPGRTWYLHTSPEHHMKRLLAAGAPDIWQMGPVWRDGELGPRHEPEFTLVEWYRRDAPLDAVIRDSAGLLGALSTVCGDSPPELRVLDYRTVFLDATGIDPLDTDAGTLRLRAATLLDTELTPAALEVLGDDTSAWLELLMSRVVEPGLPRHVLTAVTKWPASQAALARLDPRDPRVAERFELYLGGLELANGYRELTDATEQVHRFEADRLRRRALGRPDVEPDPEFLAALSEGLPECSGVALGFDRAMMALTGRRTIGEVVAFALPT